MKKKLAETTVILIATIKWSAIAAVVGGAVGLSTTAFLKSLSWAIDLTGRYQYYFVFLPLAFLLSSFLVRYLAPEAEGHGTEKVIEAIHRRSARISAAVIPVKLVASVITIASGGSAGKEGPCAQIGGGVSSAISNLFNLSDESRKKLVICGISAGFASVFGTPVAGAIFGVEVLFIGSILYDVLLPSFISGIVSYHVSAKFGILFFSHPIESLAVFSRALLIKVILMGCLFGLVSFILIEAMNAMDRLSSRIKIPSPAKALIGGLSLVFLALIFSTQFLGLGLETIESTLMSGKVVWYAFIMKIIFTAITLNFGGSGGVITPIFFIGATSGAAFAGLLGMDGKVFSAIGLVSVLAGATNAPIAASIMSVELFGASLAPYAALSCVISFLVTGHRSIYPSQILGIRKSSEVLAEVGKEVGEAESKMKLKPGGLSKVVLDTVEKIDRIVKKEGTDDAG